MPVQATPKGAWAVASMLFAYMLINFADKAVVGLAAVPIMQELELSPKQFGLLGSAFFLLFSFSGVLVGFIANRRPTRLILLLLALSWALVQFPMLFSVGFTTLLACRILLGMGEGPAAAVATHAVYKWFPDEKRTIPTALLSQGSAFGVIIALPALNWVIVHYTWHHAFGVLGVIGLIWAAAWYVIGREGPLRDPPALANAADRVPYAKLLLSRTFIGSALACFGAYWSLSLGLTWATPFIVKGLGYSPDHGRLAGDAALGDRRHHGDQLRRDLADAGRARRQHPAGARRARLRADDPRRRLLLLLPFAGSGPAEIALLMLGTGLCGRSTSSARRCWASSRRWPSAAP